MKRTADKWLFQHTRGLSFEKAAAALARKEDMRVLARKSSVPMTSLSLPLCTPSVHPRPVQLFLHTFPFPSCPRLLSIILFVGLLYPLHSLYFSTTSLAHHHPLHF